MGNHNSQESHGMKIKQKETKVNIIKHIHGGFHLDRTKLNHHLEIEQRNIIVLKKYSHAQMEQKIAHYLI